MDETDQIVGNMIHMESVPSFELPRFPPDSSLPLRNNEDGYHSERVWNF